MKKIMVVCGNGLGSSFIMELNVKKALDQLGKEAEVDHTDLTTARTAEADIFVVAQDLLENLDDGVRTIVGLENMMNIEEIKLKIDGYL
ncbi:PTS sugar transporter subunit IIB [Jeotgalibacillus soli]|uniref:PTS lactose transporter subunit IIB n=1 Tax=Jeotgalibacillus soli TaxID=889306 RepID=A0A0C2VZL3_9BACL|nr:PTS sugar transporter subunit IIB [Jeotgalibacillus soli]KIL49388.1 PTS lactose transporter subunit IIB [Jeotgalibacillus soli]